MAKKIRNFVKNGGTVIMTDNSAIIDENGRVFNSTRPGRLSDVFGIRIGSFEETEVMNELSRKSYKGKHLSVNYNNKNIDMESNRFDVLESKGAKIIANITSLDKDYPIATENHYGKGNAIYIGLPAKGELLNPILDRLIENLKIKRGPEVPSGIMARDIDNKRVLYLNTTTQPIKIHIKGKAKSILLDRTYNGEFELRQFEPDLIEMK